MREGGVAPGLLLAMPQLPDPNFWRAVLLMIEHTEEQCWGLILNRPTRVPVTEVLRQLDVAWRGPSEAFFWQGGPVAPQQVCILHPPVPSLVVDDAHEVVPGILLSMLHNQLRALAEQPSGELRFLLGYAGWHAGQLEREMSEGSWLVAPATPALVFETEADAMWEAAIGSLGIDPSALVTATGVH